MTVLRISSRTDNWLFSEVVRMPRLELTPEQLPTADVPIVGSNAKTGADREGRREPKVMRVGVHGKRREKGTDDVFEGLALLVVGLHVLDPDVTSVQIA